MAAAAPRNTKGMYSWWWDSHISPKNSKWLQENLTDMDMKVKQMIKLLEEDADSFARRAEMYYKKRPELMKLVEELYRAYRALAERYDNATGVLRQAHKTMAEAFPNQVPLILSDDSPPDFDSHTPDLSVESKTGGFLEDSDPMTDRKGLKQFNSDSFSSGEGRVRRGLCFHDSGEKNDVGNEEEIASLKKDLARLEAEKEAIIIQYQQSMKESKNFSEQVEHANAEITSLQDSIMRLEEERSCSLVKYQQCLDKIGEIETLMRESNDRSDSVKAEIEVLRGDLTKMEAEKDTALGKYSECLNVISGLEEKLRKAEAEIEWLKEELAKLMETISDLEHKLFLAEDEAHILKLEINERSEKLKISEERYQALEDSNQTVGSELESRSRELVEKQNELKNLWTCVQEERTRFMEAETAFQTLQHLHSQSLEELRSLALAVRTRDQILKDLEVQNQNLQVEVERVLHENKILNGVNMSSSITVKNLQEEILSLREMIQKLEQQIKLCVDERNALQQEIYCLKEEVNCLNEKNRVLEEQIDSDLIEKAALLEKLVGMEKLIEKNLLLENSLSDLNVELKRVREKVKTLEESYMSIIGEREFLNSQLNLMTQNFEKIEVKSNLLEKSLCDANAEGDALRIKSKSLEDLCFSLGKEKLGLVTERDSLVSQTNQSRESLKELEKRFHELEEIHAFVEKEKELILLEMGRLNVTLNTQKEEYSGFIKSSEAQLCDMAFRIHVLQDEVSCRNNEYKEELDKNVFSEIEIFILQKSIKELQEKSNAEVDALMIKTKSMDNSRLSLDEEKSGLIAQRDGLVLQLNESHESLKYLEKRFQELEEIHASVKKEKELILFEMSELNETLTAQREEYSGFIKSSKTQLCDMISRIILLQKEVACRNNEYELELDKNVYSKTEIFILQTSIKELEEKSNAEVDALKMKSKSLEDSFFSLGEVKTGLIAESDNLVSRLNESQESLKDLLKRFQELEETHALMEKENELILLEIGKLNETLSAQRVEYSGLIRSSEAQLCDMASQIHVLQEEVACRNNEYEEMLDKTVYSQMEIFILQKSMMELEEHTLSLTFNFQKLVKASDRSEQQISHLENRNHKQELEVKALTDRLNEFYLWLYDVLGILDISVNHSFEPKMGQEAAKQIIRKINELQNEIFFFQNCMKESKEKILSLSLDCQKLMDACDSEKQISHSEKVKNEQNVELKALTDHINELQLGLHEVFKIDEKNGLINETEIDRDAGKFMITKVKELNSLSKVEEENLLGTIKELVLDTLLRQREAEAAHLWTERCALDHNLRVQTEQFISLQQELAIVLQSSEELRLEVLERICQEEVLNSEMTILHQQLVNIEAAFERLKEERSAILEEKYWLEDESHFIMGEKVSQATVSVILEDAVRQSFVILKELVREMKKVHCVNSELQEKIMLMEGNLDDIRMEKLKLECLLEKSVIEVRSVTSVNEQLNCEVALVKEALGQLERKLSEAAEMINVRENKNVELEKELDDLKKKYESIFGKSSLMEMEILKKMVETLQGENADLNAKHAAHLVALVSLKDCMVSIESSLNWDEQNKSDAHVVEDLGYVHDLEIKLKAIEKALLEKLAKLEGPSSISMPETGAGEGRLLTKDIMFDEASECLSYGINRRGTLGPGDHHALKEHRSLNPSTDSLVDKLDFSETLSKTQSGNGSSGKRRVRVLERLDSDVQELTNLQLTLEDLKKKLESIEKNKKAEMEKVKGFEYDAVKGQLDEAEEAIAELFNGNRKLAKNLEEDPNETDLTGIGQRRVPEQARRGSEKLGRIQLELQRLQFLLLKLEDNMESEEKSRNIDERSKTVLLQDYLYGSTSPRGYKRVGPSRRKKAPFCGCIPRVI
ncbi:hypothetical protein SAY87_027835 [Trapa incisa]|uniref:NAB domain-containing protein n=1 Tax=Trapa incisa TaxID=236973 RepID=A0AAN7JMZ0_9MYRT|nr:hypothetical protein SAY87_027835 [Trapa incisa]